MEKLELLKKALLKKQQDLKATQIYPNQVDLEVVASTSASNPPEPSLITHQEAKQDKKSLSKLEEMKLKLKKAQQNKELKLLEMPLVKSKMPNQNNDHPSFSMENVEGKYLGGDVEYEIKIIKPEHVRSLKLKDEDKNKNDDSSQMKISKLVNQMAEESKEVQSKRVEEIEKQVQQEIEENGEEQEVLDEAEEQEEQKEELQMNKEDDLDQIQCKHPTKVERKQSKILLKEILKFTRIIQNLKESASLQQIRQDQVRETFRDMGVVQLLLAIKQLKESLDQMQADFYD